MNGTVQYLIICRGVSEILVTSLMFETNKQYWATNEAILHWHKSVTCGISMDNYGYS